MAIVFVMVSKEKVRWSCLISDIYGKEVKPDGPPWCPVSIKFRSSYYLTSSFDAVIISRPTRGRCHTCPEAQRSLFTPTTCSHTFLSAASVKTSSWYGVIITKVEELDHATPPCLSATQAQTFLPCASQLNHLFALIQSPVKSIWQA